MSPDGMAPDSRQKRALLEKLLEQSMVMVTVDARHDGVSVPEHLRGDAQLRLNLSYRFGLPTDTTDDGVHATLTFRGTPFPCHLPWESIYIMVPHATGQPFVFPADIPVEVAAALGAAALEESAERRPEPAPDAPVEKPPKLSVIRSDSVDSGDPDDSGPSSPPRRGHLRVVK